MTITGIIRKEIYHIIRDYRTLLVLFAMPILQMVMFGYALNLEIQKVELAIEDLDHSRYSRAFIRKIQGSNFFEIRETEEDNAENLFFRRYIKAYITIPGDFSEKIHRKEPAIIDVMIDGSNSNEAILIEQYLMQTLSLFTQENSPGQLLPIEVIPVFRFNPELKSTYFMVPGLLALLMIMITTLLTSITLVREKESGTILLLKLSPLNSYEIILGKVLPYVLLSLMIATTILLAGVFIFDVPIRGSILLLYLFMLIYCITGISFGMTISSVAATQQVAMLAALLATVLPSLILSGFIFPLESMPKVLQLISYLIPARYFLVIVRGIMIKNNSFGELIKPSLVLIGFSMVFMVISTKKFRKYLEQ